MYGDVIMGCTHEYLKPTKQELANSQAAIAKKIKEIEEEEPEETHKHEEV
jgi:hypothetical protein